MLFRHCYINKHDDEQGCHTETLSQAFSLLPSDTCKKNYLSFRNKRIMHKNPHLTNELVGLTMLTEITKFYVSVRDSMNIQKLFS